MRAGLLRIALTALACQLAGVPALATSSVRGIGEGQAVMACCLDAGPGHVCPMMHRTMSGARPDRGRCAMSAGCTTAPALVAALGLVLLAPPIGRFGVAPDARVRAASCPPGSLPAGFVPAVPAPPPRA
jgi:hypothetical protein